MSAGDAPSTRCPAIHVASIALAPLAELEPATRFLEARTRERTTQRFVRGTAQRDGRLDFCKQGLGPEGVTKVLDRLGGGHPWLRHLLLGTNGLGDDGATRVAESLRRGVELSTLYLGCNGIGPEGAAALAESLATNPHVRALWLKRNAIGMKGLAALLDVLPRTRVRTLDLTNCELGDEGIAELARVLTGAKTEVAHVFLGGNGLSDPEPLARWLAHPDRSPRSLFVASSRLGDGGAATLLDAASRGAHLRALDLASNGLTIGFADHAAARRTELSIEWLHLGDSPVALALGERHNALGDASVPLLARLAGTSICELGLRGAGITSRGARALVELLRAEADPPNVIFGKGIARRLRKAGRSLSARRAGAPADVRHIASVYR